MSFLPYSIGQIDYHGQAQIQSIENRLHLLNKGSAKSRGKEFEYRGNGDKELRAFNATFHTFLDIMYVPIYIHKVRPIFAKDFFTMCLAL